MLLRTLLVFISLVAFTKFLSKMCESKFAKHDVLWTGVALTVRPVRLEPPQYLRFTNRDHFLKLPKYAKKINPKKCTPPRASPIFQSLRRHWLWTNEKNALTGKKFRQINALVISLKPLLSRNFCGKSVRENFCIFHTVWIGNLLSSFFRKKYVKKSTHESFFEREQISDFSILCENKFP